MSTKDTAVQGIDLAIDAVRHRGAEAGRVPASRRNEIVVRRADGRTFTVRVKTRTGGTWQGTTSDGEEDPVRDESRFIVFVDLSKSAAEYYVTPEWWFQQDVHRNHSEYLARHPGPRTSTHHAIQQSRITSWRERWDLLGL